VWLGTGRGGRVWYLHQFFPPPVPHLSPAFPVFLSSIFKWTYIFFFQGPLNFYPATFSCTTVCSPECWFMSGSVLRCHCALTDSLPHLSPGHQGHFPYHGHIPDRQWLMESLSSAVPVGLPTGNSAILWQLERPTINRHNIYTCGN
jgi:hypothetical protein